MTGLITLSQNTVQFTGFPNEDPNKHLIDFLETFDLVKFSGVSSNAICLRLFKYLLRDKARVWLQSLEVGSITAWEELKKAFYNDTSQWQSPRNLEITSPAFDK